MPRPFDVPPSAPPPPNGGALRSAPASDAAPWAMLSEACGIAAARSRRRSVTMARSASRPASVAPMSSTRTSPACPMCARTVTGPSVSGFTVIVSWWVPEGRCAMLTTTGDTWAATPRGAGATSAGASVGATPRDAVGAATGDTAATAGAVGAAAGSGRSRDAARSRETARSAGTEDAEVSAIRRASASTGAGASPETRGAGPAVGTGADDAVEIPSGPRSGSESGVVGRAASAPPYPAGASAAGSADVGAVEPTGAVAAV